MRAALAEVLMGVALSRLTARHRIEPILRRLARYGTISDTDAFRLSQAATHGQTFRPGAELSPLAGLGQRPRLVLSGWGCRQRLLRDGRRQIFSFLLPGDVVSLATGGSPIMELSTSALTRVELVDVGELLEKDGEGAVARLLDAAVAIEERRLLDQVIRLGRHTAYERLGNLLLEFCRRLSEVGLAQGRRFFLPLTQEMLADALGMSVVHVNRVLQQLRRDRLIESQGGQIRVLEPDVLARAVE